MYLKCEKDIQNKTRFGILEIIFAPSGICKSLKNGGVNIPWIDAGSNSMSSSCMILNNSVYNIPHFYTNSYLITLRNTASNPENWMVPADS